MTKAKGMVPLEQNKTLRKIVAAADKGYDQHDKIVLAYFDDEAGEHGDTLAKFIAVELKDTFDRDGDLDHSCDVAIHYLRRAQMQLEDAVNEIAKMQMRESQTKALRPRRRWRTT